VQGYLAPPITAVFLLGLFCQRINTRGALAGLVVGFVLGMGKLTLQALAGSGQLAPGGWLAAVGSYNFLYASGWLFLVSVAIVVGVSFTAPAQPAAQLAGLTYGSVAAAAQAEREASWGWPEVLGSAVVVGLVLGIYVYFSFWL